MKKTTMIIIFTVTHMLCIILGYSIASVGTTSKVPATYIVATEETVEHATTTVPPTKETSDRNMAVTEESKEEEITATSETAAEVIQPFIPTTSATEAPATEAPSLPGYGSNDTAYDDI